MLDFHVSRETTEKLRLYEQQLHKWQKAINLVSPTTLKESWERHFVDSLQILPQIPENSQCLVDMGSGAGFPGLVLSACRPAMTVHLVESDTRKSSFLRHVKTNLGLDNVIIHTQRIEDAGKDLDKCADVVTARALASLDVLLEWAEPYLNVQNPSRIGIFPKGRSFKDEIVSLQSSHPHLDEKWHFETKESQIEPDAALIICRPK